MNPADPQSAIPVAEGAAKLGHSEVLTAHGRQTFSAESIRPQDFRQSAFLTPSELRRIRLRIDQFVRSLAARLSIYLRAEVALKIGRLHVVAYQKFAEELPNPTHITLFKCDPLKGAGLLVVPPRLGMRLVDRILGGPGKPGEVNRDLSEIETALVDQVTNVVLKEWCLLWQDLQEMHFSLLGHETSGRFLQTAPPDTAMLAVNIEMVMGEETDVIQMVLPYYTIEPMVRKLAPPGMSETEAAPVPVTKPKWNLQLNEVQVPLTAEWKGLAVSVKEITVLKPGDVLMMSPEAVQQVQIKIANLAKFNGRLGTCGHNWAVELTNPIKT
jgi:flagellar motor switch protein FliM